MGARNWWTICGRLRGWLVDSPKRHAPSDPKMTRAREKKKKRSTSERTGLGCCMIWGNIGPSSSSCWQENIRKTKKLGISRREQPKLRRDLNNERIWRLQ